MYLENWGQVLRSWRKGAPSISRNVLFLGLTSLFTDISSEMVSTTLPLYIVFFLRLTPLEFGIVDGLYQGMAALARLASGIVADRGFRHKQVATAGYALSAASKLAFLAAGSAWGALAAVILVDRTGKGIRTAPRDALISLSTSPAALATAFGVHRALDTAGAMIGPLLAFGLLALAPRAFDVLFIVSFCIALIGLGIIGIFVQNRPAIIPATDPAVSLQSALALLREPRFRNLVLIGSLLGLMTMSDGFLYLGLQRRLDFMASFLPLLYVATALVYLALAVPAGWLADRVGRVRVFLGGYLLLLLVYTSLLWPTLGLLELAVYLILFGAYYAATDGVVMALASALVPASLRGSGLALITTATSLTRLVASLAFGALWTWGGLETAVLVFTGGLAGSLILAAITFIRTERSVSLEQASTS